MTSALAVSTWEFWPVVVILVLLIVGRIVIDSIT